ncbi:hypothetical protein LCGC14_1350340 [marine sediment metagenome]|uniref:Uncharacterized protein n=1 Tax=marine sediment metagenome TaxID=412755 RepID=A0A0F9KBS6_9ZZZZ
MKKWCAILIILFVSFGCSQSVTPQITTDKTVLKDKRKKAAQWFLIGAMFVTIAVYKGYD